jgi:hypothetical protein
LPDNNLPDNNLPDNKLIETYLSNYDNYKKKIIFCFHIGIGGIGDYIKFFMCLLNFCIEHEIQIYYLQGKTIIEKYIKLKYEKMYIKSENIPSMIEITNTDNISNMNTTDYYNVFPPCLYRFFEGHLCNITILNEISKIFYFTHDIELYANKLIDFDIYTSIHLRLGDKYLETDSNYIQCRDDERAYDENSLFNYIETNRNKNILFFCDNNKYKLMIKNKYPYVTILNLDIGHTSLFNTTEDQVFNTVTEMYILANSQNLYLASHSGFSQIAAKFKNIPYII